MCGCQRISRKMARKSNKFTKTLTKGAASGAVLIGADYVDGIVNGNQMLAAGIKVGGGVVLGGMKGDMAEAAGFTLIGTGLKQLYDHFMPAPGAGYLPRRGTSAVHTVAAPPR